MRRGEEKSVFSGPWSRKAKSGHASGPRKLRGRSGKKGKEPGTRGGDKYAQDESHQPRNKRK